MSQPDTAVFEKAISELIVPTDGYWPRPWFTEHDPMSCNLLLVGASSAKPFAVASLPEKGEFLDAHFNRNGSSCRALYDRLVDAPSRTRRNIDRAMGLLEEVGWRVMQTNVTCASAPVDSAVSRNARKQGTEIFRVIVERVPWKAMVVFGAGAAKRFGKALRITIPAPADLMVELTAEPRLTSFDGRPVLFIPTLAQPGYRSTVWPYLERCIPLLSNSGESMKSNSLRVHASRKEIVPIGSEERIGKKMNTVSVVSLVLGGRAVKVAAEGLDLIRKDHPELVLEPGKSQVSIWLPLKGKNDRRFRLVRSGQKADLLIHRDVVARFPETADKSDLVPHTNEDLFRFFEDNERKVREIMSAARAAMNSLMQN